MFPWEVLSEHYFTLLPKPIRHQIWLTSVYPWEVMQKSLYMGLEQWARRPRLGDGWWVSGWFGEVGYEACIYKWRVDEETGSILTRLIGFNRRGHVLQELTVSMDDVNVMEGRLTHTWTHSTQDNSSARPCLILYRKPVPHELIIFSVWIRPSLSTGC